MKAQENQGTGTNDAEVLKQIFKDFEENKADVVKMLIGNVMNVNIDIPRVVKGDFEDEDKKEEKKD